MGTRVLLGVYSRLLACLFALCGLACVCVCLCVFIFLFVCLCVCALMHACCVVGGVAVVVVDDDVCVGVSALLI